MAKVSQEDRETFKNSSKQYTEVINSELKKEKETLAALKKDPSIAVRKKFELAEQMCYIASLYNAINTASVKIMDNVKNNDALNDARKILYKAIIYLEEMVTNIVDSAPSDLSENMEKIQEISLEQRYFLVRKLGLAIQMVIDAFGDNSKWKWSFVELNGRFAAVAKNMFDFKNYVKAYFDPSSPENENSILYIRLLKMLLDKSAGAYRDKYELSSRRMDDMKTAIKFVLASRQVCLALNEADEGEELKKKAASWNERMKADRKSGKST
ncbi:MAG: hypothetical protein J1E59_02650 [Treponema sp.]|nr:hypothetical protein [Treponema sp.]